MEQHNSFLMEPIFDQLRTVVNYTGSAISRLEEDHLTVLAYNGPVSSDEVVGWLIPLKDSALHQKIVEEQKPIVISDIQNGDPLVRSFQTLLQERLGDNSRYVRAWIGIPLALWDEMVAGVLSLSHPQPDYYSSCQLDQLTVTAKYIATTLVSDQLYQQTRYLAILEERERLARELHDNVAQSIAYLKLQLTAANQLLEAGQVQAAQKTLNELKEIAGETYTDVREEIFNLRTPIESDLDFWATLDDYLNRYQRHYGLEVQLIRAGCEPNFSNRVGSQVIRIVQEALMNIRKHAGVDEAIIRLSEVNEQTKIQIEDEGHGFAIFSENETGFGLQIMEERAASIGGKLAINSTPGKGSQITLWVPR